MTPRRGALLLLALNGLLMLAIAWRHRALTQDWGAYTLRRDAAAALAADAAAQARSGALE